MVRVGGLRGYRGLVRDLGGDPDRFTRDCDVPAGLLDDDDALIPYRQLIRLLEHSAAELEVPDFGLRLAASQDIGVVGPLAVAMQNSATVEDAMRCGATYRFLQSPALTLDIDELTDCVRVRLRIRVANMQHCNMRQAEDLGIGVIHGIIGLLARDCYQLLRVELPHEPLCDRGVYRDYFGAPVTFNCAENALYVSHETFRAPLADRNEEVLKLAARYLAEQPVPDQLFSSRVETAIRRSLGTDSCNRDSIADAMAVHPRTLQRRLEQEGETFDAIRDGVRRERAEYYLRHTNLSLSQVAGAIGYAEQAILSRSCQRWFDRSPRELRTASNDPESV